MARTSLQTAAAAWCLLLALALVAVKLAGWAIPAGLLVLFCAVWIFGAAMLWWAPTFGAWGTALYGILLSAALLRMHGAGALNLALCAGFLVGSALAVASFWQRRGRAA